MTWSEVDHIKCQRPQNLNENMKTIFRQHTEMSSCSSWCRANMCGTVATVYRLSSEAAEGNRNSCDIPPLPDQGSRRRRRRPTQSTTWPRLTLQSVVLAIRCRA